MSRLRLSSQAVRDLDEIEEYISRDNPDAAARTVILIREKCSLLSEFPGIGRTRSELLPNLRGFPVGNYVIFYRSVHTGIEVVRILHGARDIRELFGGG
ncbi:MAG TPA: type II toxin-antitoxin system RelE/ParE family toxin [Candidatus Angelobacter sp.]|nr:type II toxin-antitoxin system RelE/ParE family toxin [Candidatus Angelobacter sp.]